MKSFPQALWTTTQTGTIALFEPERVPFEDYFADEPYTYLTYFQEGKLLLVSIGGDGSVGLGVELVDSFPEVTVEKLEGRFEVESGKLFFGPGESLPDEDEAFEESSHKGQWLELPPGRYRFVMVQATPNNTEGLSYRLIFAPVPSFDGVPYL